MSLFQSIKSAQGGSSATYLKGGRHVGRIVRVQLREADLAKNIKPGFSVDIEVLHSNIPNFNQEGGSLRKGDVARANDSFKIPQSALARVQRTLAVAKAAKEMREINPATMGLDDPTEKAYEEECVRLCGPTQPLAGAIITINCTDAVNKQNGGNYTLFEPMLPTADDLKNAGLI